MADEDDGHFEDELSLEFILSIEEPELVLIEEEVTAIITELEVFVLWEEVSAVVELIIESVVEPVIESVIEPEVVEPVVLKDSLDKEDSSAPEAASPLLGTLAGTSVTLENMCTMC